MLTIEWIKNNGLLILEAITGSRAYGLDTETSDTDIRGIFILPKHMFYSLEYFPQVSNATNDIVYYELGRFMELLSKSNPTILEMLGVAERFVLKRDKIMDRLRPELFLSKQCEKSFANYAYTQVKKAYGLEKKIINPVEKERKGVMDFCFVYKGKESVPLIEFLEKEGLEQGKIGLSAVLHMKDCYNLYYSDSRLYEGVVRKEGSNEVALSHIPKGDTPVAMLYFNKDGYSVYCRKYKEYWDWVARRNEERYSNTIRHGKNYDSKNMMHVFRLLLMAKEIAVEGRLNVWREDRDFLLAIKAGNYKYDELVQRAEKLKEELPGLYWESSLSDEPDIHRINELLIEIREEFYKN